MEILGTESQRRRQAMPKMRGTGKDPLGRYMKDLIFDLEDNDPAMVKDFVDKGWADLLPEEEHPGRTTTQIANAMVRGDELGDPVEQKLAEDIGDDAHAIVHLEDPNAKEADYEKEAAKGPKSGQKEYRDQIAADSLGGVIGGGRTKKGSDASGNAEKQPGGAAKN
jgi:hypothetical protein